MPLPRPRQDTTATLGVGRASRAGNTRTSGKEQYYTPADVAQGLTKELMKFVASPRDCIWVEPAGGTGSFVEALLAAGVSPEQVVSLDIEPRHPLVKQADFLESCFNLEQAVAEARQRSGLTDAEVVCLTNPPFGRNNSLSVPFFNKLATVCDTIAFIVPRSWRKWSVVDRLDPRAHLVSDTDLHIDYVDADNAPATESAGGLATVFQVWQLRTDIAPRSKVVVEDRGYIARTTPDKADVELIMFGHSSGRVRTDFNPRRRSSIGCYLSVRDEAVLQALQEVDYTRFNTNVAFVPALGIREVMFLLNEYADTHGWEGDTKNALEPPSDAADSSSI